PFAGRGRAVRRVRSEGEPHRDGEAPRGGPGPPCPRGAARDHTRAPSLPPPPPPPPAPPARPANAFAVRRATRPTPLPSPLPHRRASGVRGTGVAVLEHSRKPAPDLRRNRPNAQPLFVVSMV